MPQPLKLKDEVLAESTEVIDLSDELGDSFHRDVRRLGSALRCREYSASDEDIARAWFEWSNEAGSTWDSLDGHSDAHIFMALTRHLEVVIPPEATRAWWEARGFEIPAGTPGHKVPTDIPLPMIMWYREQVVDKRRRTRYQSL